MTNHDETTVASPRRRIVTPRWTDNLPTEAPSTTRRRAARRAARASILGRSTPVQFAPDAKATASVFVTEPDWLLSMLGPTFDEVSSRRSSRGELRALSLGDDDVHASDGSTREAYAPSCDDDGDDEGEEAEAAAASVDDEAAVVEGVAIGAAPDTLARFHAQLDLADGVARYVWERLRKAPPLAELTSHAREALWMAARRFDPSRGMPFEAWAKYRVRGGVIDFLRSEGFTARGGYKPLRLVVTGRPSDNPTPAEKLARERCAALAVCVGPVFVGRGRRLCDAVARDDRSPEDLLATAQLVRHMRTALGTLEREDRMLLERYFLDEATLDEIGLTFGIGKSWVSRRVTEAVARLSRALRRADVA